MLFMIQDPAKHAAVIEKSVELCKEAIAVDPKSFESWSKFHVHPLTHYCILTFHNHH